MSLSKGNKFFKKGNYKLALLEYSKITPDSPLYTHARFNIGLIENNSAASENIPGTIQSKAVMQPLLSIVMPVFNVGPYLDASILSVLSQTMPDFELIIINDASTDNGKKIIEMYQSIDRRIKFIDLRFNTLGGAGIPSNIGIDAAQGKYIGFVDSDDWLVSNAFEKLVTAAEQLNAELVIGDFRTFDENERSVSISYDKGRWADIPLGELISGASCQKLFKISPVPWRKLYLTSFMRDRKIKYPEGDYFYEDNPLHWFVLSEAERVVVLDSVISYHRMAREGQTMGSFSYKLAALASHLNTVANFLMHRSIKSQAVFDEFYDYCYRTGWIADKQTDTMAKNIIKRRIFDIYNKVNKKIPPVKLRDNFIKRFDEYDKAYPELDLTIVIPVYNCEDLISESIDSVLKIKGLKFNLIIIDDGSLDRTVEICEGYIKNHDNVYVYKQGNKGAGRARNSVIPLCSGRYTYFLDADDVINARALAASVKEATAIDADLFFMRYRVEFFEEKKSRGMFNADAKLWGSFSQCNDVASFRNQAAALINYPWNRIIKTNLLHDENIFFGPTVVHNDIPYHWHSIMAAKNIGFSDEEVCTHRKFSKREQITNISDCRRLMVFEALRYTQDRIMKYPEYSALRTQWVAFSSGLIEWAKDRIPDEHQSEFLKLKKEFMSGLSM